MLSGCLGAGNSLPEWMPRLSVDALNKLSAYNLIHRGRRVLHLLRRHELIVIWRTIFIIAFVPYSTCETLFDELLGDVSVSCGQRRCSQSSETHARVLVAVADSRGLALFELAVAGTDKVDVDLDVLANQLLPNKFTRFQGVVRLPWV